MLLSLPKNALALAFLLLCVACGADYRAEEGQAGTTSVASAENISSSQSAVVAVSSEQPQQQALSQAANNSEENKDQAATLAPQALMLQNQNTTINLVMDSSEEAVSGLVVVEGCASGMFIEQEISFGQPVLVPLRTGDQGCRFRLKELRKNGVSFRAGSGEWGTGDKVNFFSAETVDRLNVMVVDQLPEQIGPETAQVRLRIWGS